MFQVALFEPEIPPNTGNIIRLCANTGSTLHLIEPLGYALDDRSLKRAGLDYHEYAPLRVHVDFRAFEKVIHRSRMFAFSTHASNSLYDVRFTRGDVFLFGPETRGLPATITESLESRNLLRLPMTPASRSLNLSNAVAIVVYEAWRQCGFDGGR